MTTHTCGGTIGTILTSGGTGDLVHIYCDRCGAYTYDTEGDLPSGTDRAANRRAFDAGDLASPDAATEETRDGVEIEAGDYLVCGHGDEADYGQVYLHTDGDLWVRWTGETSPVARHLDDHLTVYPPHGSTAAQADYRARAQEVRS